MTVSMLLQTDDLELYRHCTRLCQTLGGPVELVIGGVGRTVTVVSTAVSTKYHPYEIGFVSAE